MLAGQASSDTLRIATYHTELSRKGPGLLLRDILGGDDPHVVSVVGDIAQTGPDILLLQGVDYDHDLRALTALRDAIALSGLHYPYLFARPPNTGLQTGLDLDGDGRLAEPEDAHSYGWFAGENGMALLSRFPIDVEAVQDFTPMLWAELPQPLWPDTPMPDQDLQRLSHVGHWVVPVLIEGMPLTLLAFHASPPVFDGPEDRNGRRNHDELAFWSHFLDGGFGPAPEERFILIGNANLDPEQGEGRKAALIALLTDPRLRHVKPVRHTKTPDENALSTVDWPYPGPGQRRVSYILPSVDLKVTDKAVHRGPNPLETDEKRSRHRLVWVEIELPMRSIGSHP